MKHKKHKISTQLSAGFAVIVLITISVISLTANLLISHQFEQYVAQQRKMSSEQLAQSLSFQYHAHFCPSITAATRPGTWIISMVWECML